MKYIVYFIFSLGKVKNLYFHSTGVYIYNHFGLPLTFTLTDCSAPITFLFVNENVKCGCAFS